MDRLMANGNGNAPLRITPKLEIRITLDPATGEVAWHLPNIPGITIVGMLEQVKHVVLSNQTVRRSPIVQPPGLTP